MKANPIAIIAAATIVTHPRSATDEKETDHRETTGAGTLPWSGLAEKHTHVDNHAAYLAPGQGEVLNKGVVGVRIW